MVGGWGLTVYLIQYLWQNFVSIIKENHAIAIGKYQVMYRSCLWCPQPVADGGDASQLVCLRQVAYPLGTMPEDMAR